MDSEEKRTAYRQALVELGSVLGGFREDDPVAVMATCASIVHQRLPYASWTGFYRVVAPDLLRIGPYQGPVGCLEIPFDRGVCGVAARELRTVMVDDVHAFPGHIACDAAARSEIVVPVSDRRGRLTAVLDIDSHRAASFDDVDREGLEEICRALSPRLAGPA